MTDAAENDLHPARFPQVSWAEDDLADSLRTLYDWVESEMVRAATWYLTEKRPKARWSRALRVAAVVCATVGAGLLLAAANTASIGAAWGNVSLVAAAGAVALDKGFGFTASWMRYVTTEIAIQQDLDSLHMRWAGRSLQRGDRPLSVEEAAAELETLTDTLTRLRDHIASETATWADEVQAAVGELRAIAAPSHA